jgi:hypothetical protein
MAIISEDLFDFANLGNEYTGLAGILHISTATCFSGPRVEFYHELGRDQPYDYITISETPELVDFLSSLNAPKKELDQVIEFVKLNNEELLKYWYIGDTMMYHEVDELIANFKKV